MSKILHYISKSLYRMYQGCVNFPGNPNMESRLETTEEASRYPLTLRDLKVDGTKVSPGGLRNV